MFTLFLRLFLSTLKYLGNPPRTAVFEGATYLENMSECINVGRLTGYLGMNVGAKQIAETLRINMVGECPRVSLGSPLYL